MAISESIDVLAIALAQPYVFHLQSEITLFFLSTLMTIIIWSPHFKLPTIPLPSASKESASPSMFLGLIKCSLTFSEYVHLRSSLIIYLYGYTVDIFLSFSIVSLSFIITYSTSSFVFSLPRLILI